MNNEVGQLIYELIIDEHHIIVAVNGNFFNM